METLGHDSGAKASVRKVKAGRGKAWLGEAYELFKKSPGMWILLNILVIVITLGFSRVPLLGALVMGVVGTFMKMGLAIGASEVRQGKTLEFEHLFKAFRSENFGLIGIEAFGTFAFFIALGCGAAVVVAWAGMAGLSELFHAFLNSLQDTPTLEKLAEMLGMIFKFLMPIWAGVSTTLVVGTLILMSVIFSPYLIVFKRVPVFEALKLSFQACSANLLSLTVYGLLSIFFAFCTVFTLGLGMLVLIPIYHLALYFAYLDIFEGPAEG